MISMSSQRYLPNGLFQLVEIDIFLKGKKASTNLPGVTQQCFHGISLRLFGELLAV